MTFRAGETVGDYEILGVLGTGGMGRVFRVRNLISDRIEAMKIVLPDAASDSGLAERFLREIRVHASLEHLNIAAMRTALRVEDQIVMIMELVEGASLAAVLLQGRLELPAALSYADQVLSALAYRPRQRRRAPGHQAGEHHCDAEWNREGDRFRHRASRRQCLTITGMAPGSLDYMSPEQINGLPPDARSDIYSMGVTLYEMVTGVQPFRGENEYAIMHGHMAAEPTPPAQRVPTLPAELSAAILRALAKSRSSGSNRPRSSSRHCDRRRTDLETVPVPMPATAVPAATHSLCMANS